MFLLPVVGFGAPSHIAARRLNGPDAYTFLTHQLQRTGALCFQNGTKHPSFAMRPGSYLCMSTSSPIQ